MAFERVADPLPVPCISHLQSCDKLVSVRAGGSPTVPGDTKLVGEQRAPYHNAIHSEDDNARTIITRP
jgi:hypothetical protein